MKQPPSIEAARTAARLAPPFGREEEFAKTPYHALSSYERASILCSPIDWQKELVELASRAEPPNTSLIAAIGGVADKLAFESEYSIHEFEQATGRFGLSARKQGEVASLEAKAQVNQELGNVADIALETIASRP